MNFRLPSFICFTLLFLSTSIFAQDPTLVVPTVTADSHECALDFTLTPVGVFCNEDTGEIRLNISGGTAPFDIRWDNEDGIWGMTTITGRSYVIDDLPTGVYSVDVFDDAGCFVEKEVCLKDQVSTFNVSVTAGTDACDTEGIINLNVNAGPPPPYWVIVSGPIEPTGYFVESRNASFSVPVSGTYEVRITMEECDLSSFIDITLAEEELALDLALDAETGGIVATVTGGHPPYRIYVNNINEGGTSILTISEGGPFLIQNLVMGPYEVIIIDSEMCDVSGRINVMMSGSADRVVPTNFSNIDANTFAIQQVFPNPANNQINYTITTGDNESVEMFVRDMFGRIITTQTYTGTNNIETASVSLANLSSGVYYLELSTEREVITKKFLKE